MAEAEMADAATKQGLTSNLTLDILQIVKVSQGQHGLRHGDHTRYRQYCTRRLARIYKALNFSHGRGKYQKRVLSPEVVVDASHLMIPLISAERAWSYALELKTGSGNDPRKRSHMIRRLRKATVHASELVALCKQLGDAKTTLEAEAYSCFMFGTFLAEQEREWSRALAKFMRARKAFEQLARTGGSEQAEVCRERIEELEPSLRYCTYKRGNTEGREDSGLDADDLAALEGGSGAEDEQLKGMLSEDSEKSLASEAATSLMWRGHEILLHNKDARACVATAANQLAKLASPLNMSADRGLAIYDKAFMAYNDAKQHLCDEMATASSVQGGSESTNRIMQIKVADRALSVLLLEKTIERNKFLVASATAKLAGEIKLEKGEKVARPEDLVHLYNTLLRNFEELAESGPEVLRGMEGVNKVEEDVRMDCMLEQVLLQGQRAAALAAVHLGAGSHAEAAVLYARAAEHAAKVQDRAPETSKIAVVAQKVQSDARKARCIALADGTIAHVEGQKGLRSELDSVSIQESASAGGTEAQYLLDHLDEYKSAVLGKGASKVHIMPIPPKMTPIAVNPIVLDVAGDEIVYPDLKERAAVKKTSTLRNLFSFGKR